MMRKNLVRNLIGGIIVLAGVAVLAWTARPDYYGFPTGSGETLTFGNETVHVAGGFVPDGKRAVQCWRIGDGKMVRCCQDC